MDCKFEGLYSFSFVVCHFIHIEESKSSELIVTYLMSIYSVFILGRCYNESHEPTFLWE